jgi:hypothetical protein
VNRGKINYFNNFNELKGKYKIVINKEPDKCPICHNRIKSIPILFYNNLHDDELIIITKCPVNNCESFFLNHYSNNISRYILRYNEPKRLNEITYEENINEISEEFISIYNEANKAEQHGLKNICGPGYRKALEFLIKDYLIYKENDEEVIKNEFLGKCIKEHIDNEKIKNIAERAVWIGNDETHYNRRWEDKDVKDLKKLIDMTVRYIQDDYDYNEIMKDMSQGKK